MLTYIAFFIAKSKSVKEISNMKTTFYIECF